MERARLINLCLVLACTGIYCLTSTEAQGNSTIVFELLEEQKAETFVGSVAQASGMQSEVSSTDFQNLRYQILSSDGLRIASMFTMNIRSGQLFTNAMIDREQVCESSSPTCALKFDVTVKLDGAVKKILHVIVFILDINDNPPLFPVNVLRQNVSEASPKESDFSIPSAVDRDAQTNSGITYWIDDNPVFELQEQKLLWVSLLKIVLKQDLDRETQSEYQFLVYAKDGDTSTALTGTLTVVVTVTDANDNIPQFVESVFNFTVSEDADVGSFVGSLSATDLDAGDNGRITYLFSSSTSSKVIQLFDLDPTSGNVTVKAGLQYEPIQTFQTVVVAMDNGESPKVSQGILIINIIDVGNTPPRLSLILVDPLNQDSTMLSEDLPVSWFVGTLRYRDTDHGDDGAVTCKSLNPHFSLEPLEESGYAIEIKTQLDREAENELTVMLQCSDRGTPSLSSFVNFTVRVSDVNDNVPVFQESGYSCTVTEGVVSRSHILHVSATDSDEGVNRELTYHLAVNASKSFTIDEYSGWISLVAAVDRESEPVIRLIIEAVDKGQPPLTGSVTATIFVDDVNDNIPEITRTEYHVKENQESGTFIGQISAIDKDDKINALLTFKLISDPSDGFQVSEQGAITSKKVLDREAVDHYILIVSVNDAGTPALSSTSTLTIDVTDTNDHSPQIWYPRPGNDTLTITGSLPPGAVIAKINATDLDLDKNSKLLYLIAEGNNQIFGLDNSTGIIFLARRLTSIRDTNYRLTISVQDGGSPRLHQNTFLYINVDFTNVTIPDPASAMEQKYVIITGAIAGLTVIIAVILIAIIIKIRRTEPNRFIEPGPKAKNVNLIHSGAKIFSDSNILEVSTFKMESAKKEEERDKGQGSNTSFDSSLTNGTVPPLYRPSLTRDYLDRQIGPFSLFLEGRQRQTSEDIHSDSSADATTSDSGRGASDVEDVFSGASLPPFNHQSGTTKQSVPLIPSPDNGVIRLLNNDRKNMPLIFPPNTRSLNSFRTSTEYPSQKASDVVQRTPSKVRFSMDQGSRGVERPVPSGGVHSPNTYLPQPGPVRLHSDLLSEHKTGPSVLSGAQPLSDRIFSDSQNRGFPNIRKVGQSLQGQAISGRSVSLSMDALAEHNRLQAGIRHQQQQQLPLHSSHNFLLPPNHHHHHGQVVGDHSADDDDNNSTTTSGSYIVETIDESISASVDC